ncbi:hypothetical protein SCB71_05630 [Herbiconiux sp. KACC 21604]|uniref:hypothetical protein n=1 Tax=unclassified Herbiconiux TaxID=2618217 RepID=UPI0014921A9F|nr:hypothetical protein [Herbiconiux sp. SALV-R1]QJU52815.1 hypothetical protein HL652_03610 [Herbiconiux sp. SALV-R1]WPO87727.1 hypothetical protein SCB71_05630 [Herbiconiux sp. KACC 21604]
MAVTASVLVVAGCTGAGTGSPAVDSTLTPNASAMPDAACEPAQTPAAGQSSGDAEFVTPAALCELDGRAWRSTGFTFITNSTDWGDATTPECDAARVDAYWFNRERVQETITTIDLESDATDDARSLGIVGVAVMPVPDPDEIPRPTEVADADDIVPPATPADAVALVDAEVAACLPGSTQTAQEHGPWRGVRGSQSGDDGEVLRWWVAGDTSWAWVEAYISNTLSADEAAELEDALDTVLDAQAELIGA